MTGTERVLRDLYVGPQTTVWDCLTSIDKVKVERLWGHANLMGWADMYVPNYSYGKWVPGEAFPEIAGTKADYNSR